MKLLEDLTAIAALPGHEAPLRDYIENAVRSYATDITTDKMGNLIVHKQGRKDASKFMLSAHMDEIGVMVTFIDEKGYLRFTNLGYLYVERLSCRTVTFQNGVKGVIYCEEDADKSKLKITNFYIDIGADTREEAQKLISVGEAGIIDGSFDVTGDRIISKALDNRAGCYVLMKVLEQLQNPLYDCYFVFSSQEEVGLRGARTAAYSVEPDYALAVDVTDTGDMKGVKPMAVDLGKGAAIKVKDRGIISHKAMVDHLLRIAREKDIPYQMEVMEDGATDAGEIHLTKSGVITGGISIPTRYIHSPAEMCDKKDLESCVTLIEAALSEAI
ncbi:MAG: M20/M25/M40 family metallo-hydrolase [Bacillota bacterium]|nr:M20/M25/M40 family metallo-hydrolase [Bacillota bacterium]